MGLRLRASQQSGANLDSTCAQGQCSGDTTAIAYSSGGDNGNSELISKPRQQGKHADALPLSCGLIKRAAMSASLKALSNDDIGARTLCLARFGERCCGGEPSDAPLLELVDETCGI